MFNSRDYEFADGEIILAGRDVIGIRGWKYSSKAEREPLYAKGREPHSIQTGNFSYEGEVTMLLSEYDKLRNSSPRKSVLWFKNITMTGSYGDPTEGLPMMTHTITGIHFTEDTVEAKQGDKFMEVTLPFIATKIA